MTAVQKQRLKILKLINSIQRNEKIPNSQKEYFIENAKAKLSSVKP